MMKETERMTEEDVRALMTQSLGVAVALLKVARDSDYMTQYLGGAEDTLSTLYVVAEYLSHSNYARFMKLVNLCIDEMTEVVMESTNLDRPPF